MARQFPARLHVLLASEAPLGVVIRRGPAGAVCTVGWDRRTGGFSLGQWMRARLYERRSDLSPDGRYLIYFARGGRRHAETRGTWTAISRAPSLHAVTLWGKGDCWQGGGLFTGARSYWPNGCHFPVRDSGEVLQDLSHLPDGRFGAECLGVYFPRLLRDGWKIAIREGAGCTVFEKPLPYGWTLRKFAWADVRHPEGSGVYWDEHELERGGVRHSCAGWEWADLVDGALVWAEKGLLYRADVGDAGPEGAAALHDFNEMRFEAREAPYA